MDPRYGPIRYLADRPFGAILRRLAEGNTDQAIRYVETNHVDLEHIDVSLSGLAGAIALHAFKVASPRVEPSLALSFLAESSLAPAAYEFAKAGRHIVSFDQHLTTEFSHTDIEGMSFDDVKMPWDSFYITFEGPDAPANMSTIEGCMVSFLRTAPDELDEIVLVPFMKELAPLGTIDPNPTWVMPISVGNNQDMRHALDQGLDSIGSSPKTIFGYGAVADEVTGSVAGHYQAGHGAAALLLNLVGNALLYLTGTPPSHEDWQANAPADLVARASGAGGAARKVSQALIKEGYTKVHFATLPNAHDSTNHLGGTVRPHWRRGHWRRQRYGPGYSLVRPIRIRPTVVAGTHAEANATGRIHIVKAPSPPEA